MPGFTTRLGRKGCDCSSSYGSLASQPMIRVENVTKYYGARPAVADLSFEIAEGECVGFLGLNGAGKTTTLRLLSCLLMPTSGRISVQGFDAERDAHAIRERIGFLPDTPPVYGEMTVREYLVFAGKLRGMSGPDVRSRLPEVYRLCGLADVADQAIQTLSHGYRQRVGIGQAIIHRPALLILDEPIQGLDPMQIVEMREMIRGLRGEHTILLSSHILSEIQRTCDRILMLHKGRISASGTEEELLRRFGGSWQISIDVRATEDAARAALAGALASHDAVMRTAPAGEGVLRLEVSAKTDIREQLSRAVFEGGLGLIGLQYNQANLERVFVELAENTGPVASPLPVAATVSASESEPEQISPPDAGGAV